jgi:hypothetical protein
MKKSRLLEIIREEIASTLGETSYAGIKATPDMKNDPSYKTLSSTGKIDAEKELKTGGTVELEEDLLNEAPIYSVEDMAGFQSTLDKFREEGVSKNKALNVLLDKLEGDGTVDTNSLSKEYNVDTATFNNTEIRKFLNRPEDEAYTDKKTGSELIDFTPFLGKSNKPRGPKATDKPAAEPKAPKATTEPKAPKTAAEPKTATLTKGDDGFDKVSYSEPKMAAEPKAAEKTSPEDKATDAASKTPKLDKLANNQDSLLKAQKATQDEMRKIATQYKAAEGAEQDKFREELKKLNKLNGEIQSKIDKLY